MPCRGACIPRGKRTPPLLLGYRPGRRPCRGPRSPAPCPVAPGCPATVSQRRARSKAPSGQREIRAVRRELEGIPEFLVADAAVGEADAGSPHGPRAAKDAAAALAISQSPNVVLAAAWALAWAGQDSKAHAMATEVAKRRPKDTLVQSLWVPGINAITEINQRNLVKAIEVLNVARPYDHGIYSWALLARGTAYLRAGRGNEAAQEFQKILDLKNLYVLVGGAYECSLAQLGLARGLRPRRRQDQGCHRLSGFPGAVERR